MTQVRRDEDAWRMIGEMRNEIAQLQRLAAPPALIIDGRLPENPYPDQIADFQVQEGTVWRLRYNDESAYDYKWDVIGGPPLHNLNNVGETIGNTSNATVDLANPAYLDLPLAGDYIITNSCQARVGAGNTQVNLMTVAGPQGSGGGAVSGTLISAYIGFDQWFNMTNTQLATGIASGRIRQRVSTNANAADFAYKTLLAIPVRVG